MLGENFEFKTTFWTDYSIADSFGLDAVRDTFQRALDEWGSDLVYLTEMVLVLNWKIWQHYEGGRMDLAETYNDLWMSAEQFFFDNFRDEESQRYYFQMTD